METPALEPLFNKVAGSTFSTEHLQATASAINILAKIETKIVPFEATSFSLEFYLFSNLCKSEVYSSNIKLWNYCLSRNKTSERYYGQVFYKKAVLKNFAVFTEKHPCWSLFLNKKAGLQSWNIIKKRLQHRYFPLNTVLQKF